MKFGLVVSVHSQFLSLCSFCLVDEPGRTQRVFQECEVFVGRQLFGVSCPLSAFSGWWGRSAEEFVKELLSADR